MEIDVLGQPEGADAQSFKSKERFEKAQKVHLTAPREFYAYDIRRAQALGLVQELALPVDPYEPVIIAFSPTPFPERNGLDRHINVRRVAGRRACVSRGRSRSRRQIRRILFGQCSGSRWSLHVKDVLRGQEASTDFDVF
jgi:hypothetical protein